MNNQHGYHMNLLSQNYGFATINQPHFAYSATHGIHQSFGVGPNEHEYRSFGECSSSQRHIESSHNQYEIREDEASFDMCNDAHAQRSDENSKEDEHSEDDGEGKVNESESDKDTGDLPQNDTRINFQNQFDQNVSEMQSQDIPYFTTLEKKGRYFNLYSNLMWRAAKAHQVTKFEALMWEIQEENRENI
ncbi:hypothetical protein H5410_037424 [Solanum commersonii]|uniref:Uncharacterized protein n=1 Tax=Solanum commersonii TaxID=4109 RepID=A0A9J5Y9I0_SOLCO|nr:hypothetical protein H5410_037424 [Solanum commersonii]